MRSSPAATRRRRPEGTAVSRFEDVLWAVRAARLSRTAVPRPPAAAKYRQLLMHAVCASAGSSHCMIAPHQRLQVRSRWLFRPGQRSSGCGVLQKQGRRRVFGHTQAPVSPEPRGDVHERACGRVGSSALHGRTYTRPAAHRPPPLWCRGGLVRLRAEGVVCSRADRAAAGGGGRGRRRPAPQRRAGEEGGMSSPADLRPSGA